MKFTCPGNQVLKLQQKKYEQRSNKPNEQHYKYVWYLQIFGMWLISLFFCFCLNVFLPHVQLLLFLPDKQFPSTTEQTWLLFFFFTIQFLFFFFLFSDFLFESFQKMSTQHFNVSYPKTSKENIHVIPFLYWLISSLYWLIPFLVVLADLFFFWLSN